MSNPQSQNEPSMEEILASIRRIISEEEGPASSPEAAREEKPSKAAETEAPEAEEEVLELTEVVSEDTTVVGLGKAREEEEKAEEVVPPPARQESQAKARSDQPQTREPAMESKKESSSAESLLSQGSASATLASLSEVPRSAQHRKSEGLVGEAPNPGISDFLRAILEPHLRSWLDEHLPAITERVVREEVRRLARRAEED